jgi:hypothetical protein
LAEHLGVRPRTLYRWLGRNWDIPPEQLAMLRADAHELLSELKMLAEVFHAMCDEADTGARLMWGSSM